MATVTFDTYQYSLQTTRYNTNSNAAGIHVYSGTDLVGSAYFNYDENSANKAPKLIGNRIVLYYHMSMLDTVIDMLRNEDPVYIFYNINAKLGYFSTLKEEVGEEET